MGQKTSPAASTSLLLCLDGVDVDKTSWVTGSRKLAVGRRRKKSAISFEQQNRVLKYLLLVRCIAINHSNSLLTHFINKRQKKGSFSKTIGFLKSPVAWPLARN